MDQNARRYAEEAIEAVGRLDVAGARTAVAEAFDVDQTIGPLADAIYLACSEIEETDKVSTSTWNMLVDAVGTADLVAVVETWRT